MPSRQGSPRSKQATDGKAREGKRRTGWDVVAVSWDVGPARRREGVEGYMIKRTRSTRRSSVLTKRDETLLRRKGVAGAQTRGKTVKDGET